MLIITVLDFYFCDAFDIGYLLVTGTMDLLSKNVCDYGKRTVVQRMPFALFMHASRI